MKIFYCLVTTAIALILNLSVNITSAQMISGTVKNDLGELIQEGTAILYHTGPLAEVWPIHEEVEIENGEYEFDEVPAGQWLVLVKSDTSKYMPTFYGNVYKWDVATYIEIGGSDARIADIVLGDVVSWTGNGWCGGKIEYKRKGNKTEGDPIPDVDIVLEQIPGGSGKIASFNRWFWELFCW